MKELLLALADVLKRAELNASHQIQRETLSVRERMTNILSSLQEKEFISFFQHVYLQEGRLGVVVTFLSHAGITKRSYN